MSEPTAPPVAEAPSVATTSALPAGATSVAIETSRSSVAVKASKVSKTHDIHFGSFTGSFGLSGDTVGTVDVTVVTDTVASDADKLTAHLKDADFLDVARFPEATFHGTVKPDAAEGSTVNAVVSGPFTLRGVTKELSFPVRIDVSPTEVKGEADFTINRQDFGVAYPGKPDDLIRDEVAFHVVLIGKR